MFGLVPKVEMQYAAQILKNSTICKNDERVTIWHGERRVKDTGTRLYPVYIRKKRM